MKHFILIASFIACLMIFGASCTPNPAPTNTANTSGTDFWTIARKSTEKADNGKHADIRANARHQARQC